MPRSSASRADLGGFNPEEADLKAKELKGGPFLEMKPFTGITPSERQGAEAAAAARKRKKLMERPGVLLVEEVAAPSTRPAKKEPGPVVIRQSKGAEGKALVDVIADPNIQGGRREILVSPKEAAERRAAMKRAGEAERAAAEARVLAKEKTDFKGAMKAVMLEVAAKPADQKLLDELQDHIIERAKAKTDADKAAEMRNTMKEVLEADAEMEKTVESILEMAGYEDSIINDAARADILGNKTEILKRALAARDPKLKHPPEFATALDLAIGERSKAFFEVLKETVGTAAEVRQQRLEQAAEAAQTALAALNELDGRGRLMGKDKEKRNKLGEEAHAAAAEWLRLASHRSFERTAADLKAEAERLGIDESIPEKSYALVAPEKGVSVKRVKPVEPIVDATRADLKYSQDPNSYGKAQEFTVDTSAEVDPLLDRPQRRMTMNERYARRAAEANRTESMKAVESPTKPAVQFDAQADKFFAGGEGASEISGQYAHEIEWDLTDLRGTINVLQQEGLIDFGPDEFYATTNAPPKPSFLRRMFGLPSVDPSPREILWDKLSKACDRAKGSRNPKVVAASARAMDLGRLEGFGPPLSIREQGISTGSAKSVRLETDQVVMDEVFRRKEADEARYNVFKAELPKDRAALTKVKRRAEALVRQTLAPGETISTKTPLVDQVEKIDPDLGHELRMAEQEERRAWREVARFENRDLVFDANVNPFLKGMGYSDDDIWKSESVTFLLQPYREVFNSVLERIQASPVKDILEEDLGMKSFEDFVETAANPREFRKAKERYQKVATAVGTGGIGASVPNPERNFNVGQNPSAQ